MNTYLGTGEIHLFSSKIFIKIAGHARTCVISSAYKTFVKITVHVLNRQKNRKIMDDIKSTSKLSVMT